VVGALRLTAFLVAILLPGVSPAQTRYDLVIKQGHVIDPANRIDAVMDVAVAGGKIARVDANIPASEARRVIEAKGFYITPGLIDLHAHVFGYDGSILPDETALPAGTTTVVDAGGAGWRTFDQMLERVIKPSKTRVLALINIVGHGMIGAKYESDVNDMDPDKTAAVILKHREHIVGIKTAHFGGPGWVAIDRAIAAGKLSKTPVMIDDKIFTNSGRTSREKLLDKMRPGDIHTHMYNDRQLEVINRFTGKVEPYMAEARKRGVLFDLGHGGGSFLWPVVTKAMAQGFAPDTISTDLHTSSIMIPESDMPNCMSKLMNLGMTLQDAVLRSTASPAKAIGKFPELGTLGEGQIADIGVFRMRTGVFAFKDAWQNKLMGTKKLETVLTVRNGAVVFDRLAAISAAPAAPAEIYDLLLKGGHVIDPKNNRNERLDIAITGTQIRKIAKNLPSSHAKRVANVDEFYVAPGLIDTHARSQAVYNTLRYGVTTAVNSGGTAEDGTIIAAMSKLLGSGVPLPQVIERMTVQRAKTIGKPDLGSIEEGGAGNLAVLELRDKTALRCVMTVRNGRVVWDTEGLSLTEWKDAGPYSNFK